MTTATAPTREHKVTMTQERTDDKAALLDQLGDQVEILKSSAGWQAWLDFSSRLHTYSFRNTMLIHMQREDATVVMPYGNKAGTSGWLSVGRQVRKGETSIKIFAPVLVKLTKDEAADHATETTGTGRKLVGFKLVSVFDVSQTDGAELPKSPATMWRDALAESGTLDTAALTMVKAAAATLDRRVILEDPTLPRPHDGALGWYERGTTDVHIVDTDNAHLVATLVHELAHSLDTEYATTSYATGELVAESVAWFVTTRLGLADVAAPAYLAGWNADPDKLETIANRVLAIAKKIETAIETNAKVEVKA